jgi:hypothetical protein
MCRENTSERGRLPGLIALWALALYWAGDAVAGPPFLTDDPEPVEHEHWEFYTFSTLDKAEKAVAVQAPAFEVNYGFAPDFQAHVVVPFQASIPSGGATAYGAGDSELGIKYRFLQETDSLPMAGIFPMLEVPTGQADRGLGNGKAWAKFPLWLQKSWGEEGRKWTTYGGGGYALNTASGQRSFPYTGWLLQKQLSEKLTLGGEIFAQGRTEDGGQATVIGNFGGHYDFTKNFSLLFSAGHSIAGDRHLLGYLGAYWTW